MPLEWIFTFRLTFLSVAKWGDSHPYLRPVFKTMFQPNLEVLAIFQCRAIYSREKAGQKRIAEYYCQFLWPEVQCSPTSLPFRPPVVARSNTPPSEKWKPFLSNSRRPFILARSSHIMELTAPPSVDDDGPNSPNRPRSAGDYLLPLRRHRADNLNCCRDHSHPSLQCFHGCYAPGG
jgi:hypothetical protein